MVKISAAIPSRLRDNLEEHARANDRSMSAEVRRALTAYLTSGNSSRSVLTEPRTLPSQAGAGGTHPSRERRAVEARLGRDAEGAA
jgi:ribbon-helix-helix CopG family protein